MAKFTDKESLLKNRYLFIKCISSYLLGYGFIEVSVKWFEIIKCAKKINIKHKCL